MAIQIQTENQTYTLEIDVQGNATLYDNQGVQVPFRNRQKYLAVLSIFGETLKHLNNGAAPYVQILGRVLAEKAGQLPQDRNGIRVIKFDDLDQFI